LRAKFSIIMNKFRFYFILSLLSIVLFSCSKDDDVKLAPARDFTEQYPKDIEAIEAYLKSHSFTVVDVEGRIDVKIDTFIVGNAAGKVSIWNNTQFPLQSKIVKNDDRRSNLVDGRVEDPVDYKMYYFIINEGGGKAATRFDSTYVSSRGWRLNNKQFDASSTPFWATFPKVTQSESTVISGFRQFTSLLKGAEDFTVASDGTVVYNNYGVGVVFLPSGLGYYNLSRANIPSYSPLVFTVRLHSVRERDHDRDGVMSKYENGTGVEDLYSVDSDGDNVPDFLDLDDDNDGVRTTVEIRNPATGKPFPFDEIPTCVGGTIKKYLDPNCQ
jgi:FKBP-type peptidyl-prolyl cis-trans isomerase FkpA